MSKVRVLLRWEADADISLPMPAYETAGAAGADIRANFAPEIRVDGVHLAVGDRCLIPTGLSMSIPEGYEVQIRPRSGLALKSGIGLVNAPGTIDSDYRGPVGVVLINHGSEVFHISHGLRIAQMVIAPVVRADFDLVVDLDGTERGVGGFGSTGTTT